MKRLVLSIFSASLLAAAVALPASGVGADTAPVFALKWNLQNINPGGHFAYGLEVDPLGRVLVVNRGWSRIEIYDSVGNLLGMIGSSGSGPGQFSLPWGLGLDAAGNIYVADTNNNRIQKLSSAGAPLLAFGAFGSGDGQFNAPTDVAVSSDGSIYVADQGNVRVEKFDAAGNFLAKWTSLLGLSFGATWSVSADAYGNVFVLDDPNSRVVELDHNDAVVQSITIPTNFAWGVSVAPSGHVLVADNGNGMVHVFDASGALLYDVGSPGSGDGQYFDPFGVAEDANGNVYVSDRQLNRVQKFVPVQSTPAHLTSWGRLKHLYR